MKKNEIYGYKVDIYNLGLTMLCIMSYENPRIKVDKNNYNVSTKVINIYASLKLSIMGVYEIIEG